LKNHLAFLALGMMIFGLAQPVSARREKVFLTYCYVDENEGTAFGGKPTTHDAATSLTRMFPPGSRVTLLASWGNGRWNRWHNQKRTWEITDVTAHAPYRRAHLLTSRGGEVRHLRLPTLDVYVSRRHNCLKKVSATVCLVDVE